MRFLEITLLLSTIAFMNVHCRRESCDSYKFGGSDLRIIQDVDPVLTYISADQLDTIKVIPERALDQGIDVEKKEWLSDGYRTCGATANMNYSNTDSGNPKSPFFSVIFSLYKQRPNAIEIPSLRVARVFLKKNYEYNRLTLFNDQNEYTINYIGTLNFKGQKVNEVYEFTGINNEAGNIYLYSLYEGLLRIEEQGKSWERIWEN